MKFVKFGLILIEDLDLAFDPSGLLLLRLRISAIMMSSCFQLGFLLLLDPISRGSSGFSNVVREFTFFCYVQLLELEISSLVFFCCYLGFNMYERAVMKSLKLLDLSFDDFYYCEWKLRRSSMPCLEH